MKDIDPKFGKLYDPHGKAGEVTADNSDDVVIEGSDGQLGPLLSPDRETTDIKFGKPVLEIKQSPKYHCKKHGDQGDKFMQFKWVDVEPEVVIKYCFTCYHDMIKRRCFELTEVKEDT